MDRRDYIIVLYDYYGELLSEKNKEYFEQYYFENLSLGEISDNLNVSRNAIHKGIKNIEDKLIWYEDKLKLYEKRNKILDIISKIDEDIQEEIKRIL